MGLVLLRKSILTWCLLFLVSCSAATSDAGFPIKSLQIGTLTVPVQVAATPELRARGLMYQQSAEPGMLLLYSEPQQISLWMYNTRMPLDVAFIDANWRIHHIVQLIPFDETPVSSEIAVMAALEMPRGWFAAKQLGVGSVIRLLD